jgi:hypothetical protein
MVEKEFRENNFSFDSLKSKLNLIMEEKGIVAVCGLPKELLRRRRRRSLHATESSDQWSFREMM